MYDTVEFYLLQEDYPNIDFLKVIPYYIHVVSEGNSKFGRYVVGNYGGYKVLINPNKISFTKCSLCRFKFGNNLKTLSGGDTRRIIGQMEDELHLPINEANLTRIDLAQHIPMKHNPGLYLPLLGYCRYYKRLEQPNGINYINTKRVMAFYNKTVEQQDKNKPLPEIYEDKNLLRYELRFIKRLTEQFNLPKVTCSLLYDEKFHVMLVKQWRNEYLNINKVSINTESIIPTGSSKHLIEQLAARTILNIGQEHLFSLIKEWQELDAITKKQAFDLKQALQKISKAPDRFSGNELITELDKKVKEAARFF